MNDFSHLQSHAAQASKTARHTFYEIKGKPWLDVAPAAAGNKPYFNALLRSQGKNRKRLRSGKITADDIERARDEDRRLYAKHVVKGWGNVRDAKGKAVAFSQEACKDFLEALPYWLFDDLRGFASDPDSFVDDDDEPIDTGELGKNSPGG